MSANKSAGIVVKSSIGKLPAVEVSESVVETWLDDVEPHVVLDNSWSCTSLLPSNRFVALFEIAKPVCTGPVHGESSHDHIWADWLALLLLKGKPQP